MSESERLRPASARSGGGGEDGPGEGGLAGVRSDLDRLLEAGDRVIERSLSPDSEQWVAQRRQMGGE